MLTRRATFEKTFSLDLKITVLTNYSKGCVAYF
uniref:Uncharacterized protein n=1 Tax=Anguilla anguilla TaxID=7936 RepID=A0A0E9U951_ANGAN